MRLDANGIPLRLDVVEHDESHQLIEECMLAANEACALETKNRQTASVYRVHEKPNPEKLEEYAHFAKTMGFKPGDLTKRGAIQKLLTDAEHTPHSKAMRYNLLRSLMRATYSPEPRGHFGLSKTNYTHFTSPIRRYADLLVHRALFSHKAADRFFSPEKLKVLCRHISDQERNSSDAETESVKLKKLQYLQIGASQTPPRLWQANIVEVEATGLRLDLPEVDLPASLPGRSLEKMGYRLDFRSNEFHARGGLPNLASGLALQVEVDAIDFGRFRLTVKLPGSASTLPQEPRREFSRGPARTHKKPEVSHRAHKKAKQGDKGKRRRR
jgi:ribonuclease R